MEQPQQRPRGAARPAPAQAAMPLVATLSPRATTPPAAPAPPSDACAHAAPPESARPCSAPEPAPASQALPFAHLPLDSDALWADLPRDGGCVDAPARRPTLQPLALAAGSGSRGSAPPQLQPTAPVQPTALLQPLQALLLPVQLPLQQLLLVLQLVRGGAAVATPAARCACPECTGVSLEDDSLHAGVGADGLLVDEGLLVDDDWGLLPTPRPKRPRVAASLVSNAACPASGLGAAWAAGRLACPGAERPACPAESAASSCSSGGCGAEDEVASMHGAEEPSRKRHAAERST